MKNFKVFAGIVTIIADSIENARNQAQRLSKKYGRATVYQGGQRIARYQYGAKIQ